MLKAVIDANVWVSGLISQDNSEVILDMFRAGRFEVFCAPELLDELEEVVLRPRIAQRIQNDHASQLIELLKTKAGFLVLDAVPQVSRDPKDDAYLACAQAAGCEYLVSGDKDLLTLGEYEGIKIVTPATFAALLQSQSKP